MKVPQTITNEVLKVGPTAHFCAVTPAGEVGRGRLRNKKNLHPLGYFYCNFKSFVPAVASPTAGSKQQERTNGGSVVSSVSFTPLELDVAAGTK